MNTKTYYFKQIVILTLLAFLPFVFSCGPGEKRTIGSMTSLRSDMISKEELRDQLNILRDDFVAGMTQTSEQIESTGQFSGYEKTRHVRQMRVTKAIDATLEPDDPVEAFMEIWGLVIRMRIYLEQGDGKNLYGQQQPMVVDFIKQMESRIENIGKQFLNDKIFSDAKSNLIAFSARHPIKGTYNDMIIPATRVTKEKIGTIESILNIPMAPFKAIEGVDRTADAIHQVRNSADRFTDVVKELPETTRWEAVMLLEEFNESPMTKSFLASLEKLSDSSTRLSKTVEVMPEQVRKEAAILIKDIEQAQSAIQETLKLAKDTSIELQNTADKTNNAIASFEQTAKTLNETADSWDKAATSSAELVKLFSTSTPRNPNDPPPFGMRDFNAMVTNIGQTAEKINRTVLDLQAAMDSDAKEKLASQARTLTDYIFKRQIQILLIFFALLLAYRLACKKFFAKKD